jgi:hypothetical protein
MIQALDMDELEEWIANGDEHYKNSIVKLVHHFYDEYNLLSAYQKTIVLSAYQLHKSVIYGIFLATKQCSELEYTAAILASQCLIPNIFSDVVKKEYKEAFDEVKNDALILTNYLQHASNPGISIQAIIKQEIHNWGFLPESAKYPLLEAIRQSINPEIQDYSSAVVLFGKSLEICIKQLVFDKFKSESGITFHEEKETRIFIENNNQIEKLARYIAKPPHRIELGSMLVVLEKHGGRTANSNELLKAFFNYISTTLKNNQITDKEWIEHAKTVSDARNAAAHAERFNLEELKKVEKLTYELLAAF